MRVTGYISGNKIEADLDLSRVRGMQGKTQCPVCPTQGKQNIKDTPLSVNKQKEAFLCHKCGWSGGWSETKKEPWMETKEYKKPNIGNQTKLIDSHLISFSKRGITQEVLIRNKVTSAKNNFFAFTYYDGEEPVKVKYKTPKDGNGKSKLYQEGGCKPWIYKYNDLVDQKEVMICEGEEEALIWEVAGFKHAASVDSGAPNPNDNNVAGKLQCITNCFDVFENAETIYIAVDNDTNGHRLRDELVRMFGAEKCKIIDFSPYKDANEYHTCSSTKTLIDLKNEAKDVQIEGVFKASDFREKMYHAYKYGQPVGTTTYFNDIDKCWKWRMGEVNVWTGYNNEGKSMLLKQLCIAKSIAEGWRHAVFSPEEFPADEWYTDVAESFVGKSFNIDQKKFGNYATEEEFDYGMEFCEEFFFNVYPKEDHGIDELLKKFSYVVRKNNVKVVILDPYNQIHHRMQPGEREDLYISRFMSKLKKFAVDHSVSVNLVAHQNTPIVTAGENYPEPNLFKVKGGGTFADKADNVLAVWRVNRNTDQRDTLVHFISQKIKKQKLTGIPGTAKLRFDRDSNRYLDLFDRQVLGNLIEQILSEQQPTQNTIEYYEKDNRTFEQVEADFLGEAPKDCPF